MKAAQAAYRGVVRRSQAKHRTWALVSYLCIGVGLLGVILSSSYPHLGQLVTFLGLCAAGVSLYLQEVYSQAVEQVRHLRNRVAQPTGWTTEAEEDSDPDQGACDRARAGEATALTLAVRVCRKMRRARVPSDSIHSRAKRAKLERLIEPKKAKSRKPAASLGHRRKREAEMVGPEGRDEWGFPLLPPEFKNPDWLVDEIVAEMPPVSYNNFVMTARAHWTGGPGMLYALSMCCVARGPLTPAPRPQGIICRCTTLPGVWSAATTAGRTGRMSRSTTASTTSATASKPSPTGRAIVRPKWASASSPGTR